MNASLDPTKLPYYKPPVVKPETITIPQRHACGEIVNADLRGEYVLFYSRFDALGTGSPLLSCPACEMPLNMDWMRPLWLVDPMPYDLALRTVNNRVCSNCWGMLVMTQAYIPIPDEESGLTLSGEMVYCKKCLHETRAYVTTRWVGRAREEDYLNYGLAIIGLAEAMQLDESDGLPIKPVYKQPKKTSAELIASLGF